MPDSSLKRYLDNKKCFKLICGAGNRDFSEITKLCAIYASAGCRFFDVNASVDAIRAAKEGIKFAGKEGECFICVSVGIKNDPHLSKCSIASEKCTSCGACEDVCIQRAICKSKISYYVNQDKCIGCGKCRDICKYSAITKYSSDISLSEIIPPLLSEGLDCIEYHIITENENDINEGWKIITGMYKGPVCVALDRSKIGNEQVIKQLKAMRNSCDNLFIVQADGAPMTGGADDYRTTLQAVAMADIIDKADVTPYIIMSGGTNKKTHELASLCDINVTGIATGSYARKIVRDYLKYDILGDDKKYFDEAVSIAKKIVNY